MVEPSATTFADAAFKIGTVELRFVFATFAARSQVHHRSAGRANRCGKGSSFVRRSIVNRK
jgi:hypothetical protein